LANVLDIRRRIRSVRNTRQITKAMKMVSAAKLRRAQERALAARPYARMLAGVLRSLVARAEIYDPETGQPRHPLLARREEKIALLIVVSGDKGLAGAFNTNILKAAQRFLQSKATENVDLECVGRKARDFLRRRFPSAEVRSGVASDLQKPEAVPLVRTGRIQIVGERVGMLGKLEFADARALAESVVDRYTRGDVDAVYLLYNEFKSVISQRLVVDEILPIEEIGAADVRMAEALTEEQKHRILEAARTAGVGVLAADTREMDQKAAAFAASPVDYIYEQPAADLFNSLLPRYVSVQIFHALLESVAAEHAARMTAMDSATSNAEDMIDSLTLVMNRARQARITKEIIEVVSGAASV
jgi:F-type H+-transporting ATPase subunit gamma